MKKKILIYFNSLKPSGGIERVIATLANKFCEQYDVTILVKDESESFYKLNEKIHLISLENELRFNMNSKLSRIFSALNSVIENRKALSIFLKNNSFDYYYIAHPLNALEFHFAHGINKKDTIISEHGAPDAYNVIYKVIKKWLYPKAKQYVVPTTSDTKYYLTKKFPAIYLPHFKSDLLYERASLKKNIALNIGRFTQVKQQIKLLRIWSSLVNENKIKDWKLFLVGVGELKEEFESYIKEHKLQDFVFIFPPRQDVEYYYKEASLFLLTSKTEGFGMVLLEAISFGLPCISFDCPSGPRDIIKNNKNGYLVELDDEKEFEDSVLKFIEEPDLKNRMSEESFVMSKTWDDEKLLQEWYNILN